MNWSMFMTVAVVGLALVATAFLVDRLAYLRRRSLLESPPEGSGEIAEGTPTYVLPQDIPRSSSAVLTPDDESLLRTQMANAVHVEAGWTSPDFETDRHGHRAIFHCPIVLVTDNLSDVRMLYGQLAQAQRESRPLVVVAAHVDLSVTDTLIMNVRSGNLACLAVQTDDIDAVAQAAGATVVSSGDLMADYCPPTSLGTCALWVSNATASWIVA